MPDHDKGGEMLLPSHVWIGGMSVPALKADEARDRFIFPPDFVASIFG